jgi:hypothetical protein
LKEEFMPVSIHSVQEFIPFIIACTLAGAFVFTVIITCLSLVGWVKFADSSQQKKMFYILIVQLVSGCVAFFFGYLNPNPKPAIQKIESVAGAQAVVQFAASPDQERISHLLDRINELPDVATLELGKNPPFKEPDADIDKVVALRDPTNQRLTNAGVAKQMLKMRAVMGGKRSEQELAAWEAAVKSAK